MKPCWAALLMVLLTGCGTANGTGPSPGAMPAPKWEAPPRPGPSGGQTRTTIYYGPWPCSREWMNRCERKCTAQGHKLMGCMWLADIKTDWQGRFLGLFPSAAGGRLAITHCCCDYPKAQDVPSRREQWRRKREAFRQKWQEEFGEWPSQDGRNHPGHHIRDLQHGGDPIAEGNILPAPPAVHDVFTEEYPLCYAEGGKWLVVGPDRPYSD